MTFRIAVLLLSTLGIDPSRAFAQSLDSDRAQSLDSEEAALFGEADQKAARLAFKQGRAAFEEGRFADALERFEHAYALSGESELLFNIGLAADRIREDERALEAFERYLRETPASAHREQVRLRVDALREVLARSKIDSSTAPTPREVAVLHAQDDDRAVASSAPDRRDDGGSVLGAWWFWAGASVLLIAGGVTAYVLLAPEDSAELPKPNTGIVVLTLERAR